MQFYKGCYAAGEKAIAAWNWRETSKRPQKVMLKLVICSPCCMVLIRGNKQLAWDVNYSGYFLVCWAKPRFKLTFNSVAKIFATHTANNFLKTLFTCQYFCFALKLKWYYLANFFVKLDPKAFLKPRNMDVSRPPSLPGWNPFGRDQGKRGRRVKIDVKKPSFCLKDLKKPAVADSNTKLGNL